ncbi:MAG: ankyrin repeat domain-containing protein [Fibromonadales bacterium]|nr:ankyrin repeat domain-containing protein [Fibromonadales bacterium]
MKSENCPKCLSANTYFSKKRNVFVCEDCESEFTQQTDSKSLKLFFSYGHDSNKEIVIRIKDDLEKRGHSIWIDNEDINSGENWRQRITEGITSSSTVLAFLSQHSTRDPGVCRDELRIALCVKGSYIKTVLLEKEDKVRPPPVVTDIQWLDFSTWTEEKAKGEKNYADWYKKKFDELCRVLESPEAIHFSGEIEDLRKILHPVVMDEKEQNLMKKKYVERLWLDNTLEDWRKNNKTSKAFLLFGTPGAGKSAFAVNTLFNNPNAVCGFFCQWDKPEFNSEKRIICTLAFKLAARLPDYRKILLEILKAELKGNDIDSSNNYNSSELLSLLIVNPLRNCIDGNRDRFLFIIDGLDEAKDGVALAQSLVRNMSYLPEWIGVVITSRPESEIKIAFQNFDPVVIDASSQENNANIRSYLQEILAKKLEKIEEKNLILHQIVESCEGSFLYAELFAEDVLSGRIDILKQSDYPRGLTSFYQQSFRRKFPNSENFHNIKAVLEIMLADEGLPVDILKDVLGMNRYAYREFRDLLGSLLIEKNKSLAFCHKSLADWLTDEGSSGKYFVDSTLGHKKLVLYAKDNLHQEHLKVNIAKYFVSASLWQEYEKFLLENNQSIEPYWQGIDAFPKHWDMKALLSVLKKICEEPDIEKWEATYSFFAKSIKSQRLANVFFEIVCRSDAGNFFKSKKSDRRKGALIDSKIYIADHMNRTAQKCREFGIEIPSDADDCIELAKLTCFCHEGKADEDCMENFFEFRNHMFVNNICRLQNPGNYQSLKELFNTYCFANEAHAYKPDFEKLCALIKHGANVNAPNRFSYTPLHKALGENNIEIIKFLIFEAKADVNAKDKYGSTPLHIVVRHGNSIEAIEILVSEMKVDVNAKDNDGSTPLHAAGFSGNIEFAKFLVSKGADIHAKNKYGLTPLDSAEMTGKNAEVIQYLSEVSGHDSILTLSRKANLGDSEAMLSLALKLRFAYGSRRKKEVDLWIETAAHLGNAEAQFELSKIYMNEMGDRQKSFEWLEKSAMNGYAQAKHDLAAHYLSLQDNEMAAYWMEKKND